MKFEELSKLPRLPLSEIYDYEGARVAVFDRNQAHVGRLKMVRAGTRGNMTLAIVRTRVHRRNGRVTQHGQFPVWWFREPDSRARDFAVLEAVS